MSERIDINKADWETLQTLPGIGEKLAQRIVTYRESVHPFAEVIELTAVPGISEAMVRRLEERVMVTPAEAELAEAEPEEAEPVAVGQVADEADDDEIEDPEDTLGLEPINVTGLTTAETAVGEEPIVEAILFEPDPIIEETARPEPAAEAVAFPPPTPDTQRRFAWGYFLSAIAGGILGALLTLLVLLGMNQTLQFASADRMSSLEKAFADEQEAMKEIDEAVGGVTQGQTDLTGSLMALNERVTMNGDDVDRMATRTLADLADLETGLAKLETESQAAASRVASQVVEIRATAGAFGSELEKVTDAAARFDGFLLGLRELLEGVETDAGQPVTATATPRAATATPDADEATATATRQPTRTPRASATPLATATTAPTATATVVASPTPTE